MIHKDSHILFVLEHLCINQTHVVGKQLMLLRNKMETGKY